MQFASVLFHDPDDGGYNYERTAFVPDDWTSEQVLAAFIQAARDRGEEDEWLVPLLEHDGRHSLALDPVIIHEDVRYIEARADFDFTESQP